jgi:hypothetical protein
MLLILSLLLGYANTTFIWYRGTTEYKMIVTEKHKVMIEEKCLNSKTCESYRIATSKPQKLPKSFQPDLAGGRNPYSLVCLEYLKLNILILTDSNGNENSFCILKDQSLIDSAGLARMYHY